jgi:6-phosphogluconolactonase/glucosamine-6-phosphate isomerase/deaminase
MSEKEPESTWIEATRQFKLEDYPVYELVPTVLPSEEAVGEAMLAELEETARQKEGYINIALLGGRGGQALHRLLGERARQGDPDGLIARLNVFTQDALAPMPMSSTLSFVRDFERLLGPAFFERVHRFVPMRTDKTELLSALKEFSQEFEKMGGLDIFFLGHGPEPGDNSHLAYIRSGSGAKANSLSGLIPISPLVLEHHITKFKAGGMPVSEQDEAETRAATHIMTLGPAAILGAKKLVQSVVDASTAPAKKRTFPKVLQTTFAADYTERAAQLDLNPGLWVRLHPHVKSFILPDILEH